MSTAIDQQEPVIEAETEMIFCLQSDNQRHFTKLYNRFSAALFGLLLKWVEDRETAENLLQDVFVKAWRNRGLYDAGKGRIYTWLYKITRNACVDYFRSKNYKNNRAAVLDEDIAGLPALFHKFDPVPDTIGLRKLVNTLKHEEKEVVVLMYFKGLTQRQIAEVMNIPLGTVKTRMSKAIKELRYFFKNDWKQAMEIISLN